MKLSEILQEILSQNPFFQEIDSLEKSLIQKYPQLKELKLGGKSGVSLSIHSIRVKTEYHGQGIGTKVLNDVKEFATRKRLPILLTPESDRGKKEALLKFYKNNGFKKCTDPEFTSMFGTVFMWKP
jgi:GNAT superfamily N-acetyltransferase